MDKQVNNKVKLIIFIIVSITGLIYYYLFKNSLYPVESLNISDQYMFIEDFFGNDGVYGGSNLIVKINKEGKLYIPFSKVYTRAQNLSSTRDLICQYSCRVGNKERSDNNEIQSGIPEECTQTGIATKERIGNAGIS